MTKKRRKFLIVCSILLTFTFIAGMIGPDLFENRLKSRLIAEFDTQTNHAYNLSISDINISLWSRTLSGDSILVIPTSDTLEIKKASANSLSIEKINWFSLIAEKVPVFGRVRIIKPEVELNSRRISSASPEPNDTDSGSNDIKLSVFDVIIEDGSGKVFKDNKALIFSMDSFNLHARDLNVNTLLQGAFVPYMSDLSISGENLIWNHEEDFYRFTVDAFAFNKKEKQARISDLKIIPLASKEKFAFLKGRSVDRFDLSVSSADLKGLDLDSLFVPVVDISKVDIQHARLEVFKDKTLPGGAPRYKPLLHEASTKIGFPFSVDSIQVRSSYVSYGELHPGAAEEGSVSFEEIEASIQNFRSSKHHRYVQDSLIFNAKTLFMGESLLDVQVHYAVFDEKDHHFVKAALNPIDGTKVNNMLENAAFTHVESGFVNSLDIDMELTRTHASGSIKLDYENLKISVLDRDDNTRQDLGSRLKTFLANTLVMRKNNTGKGLKPGIIDFKRPPEKAIFGYWWKAIQSGLESTIK